MMSYKVYFDQLHDGALAVYDSDAEKSHIIANGGSEILEIDNAKRGPRVFGDMFEISSIGSPYPVLISMLDYFSNLNTLRNNHDIIVAHRGFQVLPTSVPGKRKPELTYYINCSILSLNSDLGTNCNFSESLKVPVSFSMEKIEYVDINLNDMDSRNNLEKTLEVAIIMCA